jgi:uncharacterized alpha-E superfamily protein
MMLSRVADTLYWLSRYLERAEHTARLLDLQLHLMLDQTDANPGARWERMLANIHLDSALVPVDDPYDITHSLTFDVANDSSILACISAARENARHVREQISSEMWEQLNRLYFQIKSSNIDLIWNDQPHEFFGSVKEGVHLFQGITDSTMSNGEGWRFIQVGRYIERASMIARLVDVHYRYFGIANLHETVKTSFLEWVGLLKACTAYEAYCKVYTANLRPATIAEFLILNAEFPHTLRFSVDRIYEALQAIANTTESKRAKHVNRLAGRLDAMLDYGQVDEIVTGGLHQFLEEIQMQCTHIHNAITSAYIVYPADEFVS